jgi:hypothetical protein
MRSFITYIISVIKSRRMGGADHVERIGEMRNTHKIYVGKPEGKRELGRTRHNWEDNIRMDLTEIG